MTYELTISDDEVTPDINDKLEQAVKARVVDNGIGPYEFWGARGVDHQYETEVELDATLRVAGAGSLDDSGLRDVLQGYLGGRRTVPVTPLKRRYEPGETNINFSFRILKRDGDVALVDVEAKEVN